MAYSCNPYGWCPLQLQANTCSGPKVTDLVERQLGLLDLLAGEVPSVELLDRRHIGHRGQRRPDGVATEEALDSDAAGGLLLELRSRRCNRRSLLRRQNASGLLRRFLFRCRSGRGGRGCGAELRELLARDRAANQGLGGC